MRDEYTAIQVTCATAAVSSVFANNGSPCVGTSGRSCPIYCRNRLPLVYRCAPTAIGLYVPLGERIARNSSVRYILSPLGGDLLGLVGEGSTCTNPTLLLAYKPSRDHTVITNRCARSVALAEAAARTISTKRLGARCVRRGVHGCAVEFVRRCKATHL